MLTILSAGSILPSMDIDEALQVLGLNKKQSAVYVALLQLGKATAYGVATKSGLKKPTTYVILDELIDKGLVQKVPRAKKMHFVARPPEEAFAVAEEKLQTAKSILPELTALAGTHRASVRARYFEGPKQVRDAYFEALEGEGTEILGWISDTVFREVGGKELYKEFQPKRIQKGIRSKLIVPNTEIMKKYASDDTQTLKETRVEQGENYRPASEMLLVGSDRVVITSFEEMMALSIESKKIHDLLKGIFEAHWETLKK